MLEQTFLITANPQIVILILKEMIDIGRTQVVSGIATRNLLQCPASFGYIEQSTSGSTQIKITCTIHQGTTDRHLRIQGFHVVTRIGQLPSGIVITQNTIETDDQEPFLVGA